jgi:hypothetical protein
VGIKATNIAYKRSLMNPVELILDKFPPRLAESDAVPKTLEDCFKDTNKIMIMTKYESHSKGKNQEATIMRFVIINTSFVYT